MGLGVGSLERALYAAAGAHSVPLHTENGPVRCLFTIHDICLATQAHCIL